MVVNKPNDTTQEIVNDTKPQPQWLDNWLGNSVRADIYNTWAHQ